MEAAWEISAWEISVHMHGACNLTCCGEDYQASDRAQSGVSELDMVRSI